jgi:peptidoglycan/LPS O-acetylase OafA/YrhL
VSETLPAGRDERTGRAQAARTLGLVPSLDGIRGIGIMLVVFVHLDPFIHSWTEETPGLFVFMNIFFVMSGFLITAILLREHDSSGRIRLTPFYQGRVLRLFPALCAMVAVEFIWAMSQHYPVSYELKSVGSAVTYLSNWGLAPWRVDLLQEARYPTGMGQLWSLAVEEQFYLFWPLVLIALLTVARRFRLAPVIVVVVAIVFVAVRRALAYQGMPSATFHALGWGDLYARTDYRLDDLLWGVLLAMLWVRGWFPRKGLVIAGWLGAAVLVTTMFVATLTSGWMYLWGMPVMAIAAVVLILACVEADWPVKRLLETKWLCAIGVISYGIYVWHLLADTMVMRAGPHWPAGVQVLAAVSLTAAMALASWFLVEKPFLRMKDRLRSRNRAASPVAEAPPVPADASTDAIAPEIAQLFDTSPTPD